MNLRDFCLEIGDALLALLRFCAGEHAHAISSCPSPSYCPSAPPLTRRQIRIRGCSPTNPNPFANVIVTGSSTTALASIKAVESPPAGALAAVLLLEKIDEALLVFVPSTGWLSDSIPACGVGGLRDRRWRWRVI